MTVQLIIAMPDSEAMAQTPVQRFDPEIRGLELHTFPDGETYH